MNLEQLVEVVKNGEKISIEEGKNRLSERAVAIMRKELMNNETLFDDLEKKSGCTGKAKQKIEAVLRMVYLNMFPNAIADFVNDDIVNKSETIGILYWFNDKENELKNKLEEEWNAVIFHAICGNYNIGKCMDFLYVSSQEDEWEMDRTGLKEGYAISMCHNFSYAETELGEIGIMPSFGGLRRTA